MTFAVDESGAYAVLFSVLIAFGLMAVASADYFGCCLPAMINDFFVLRHDDSEQVDEDGKHHNANRKADFFLSARDSASASAIALSFFASGMGAWVLYAPAELGANPSLSWLGIIGYAFASASPAFVVFAIGPMIKKRCSSGAFNVTDFGRERYGRTMQFTIAIFSIFYMFIYLCAEYTTISAVYATFVPPSDTFDPINVSIAVGVITILYTSIGGLPASIVTDRFQGIMVGILVIILIFAVSLHPANQITGEEFARASKWTVDGFMAGVTLFIAVLSAEMFNLGTWQRVWAAKDEKELTRGFIGGSVLIFLLMMFFGVISMVAYALYPEDYDGGTKFSALAFFDILEPLASGWHVITLILVTSLCSSSVDTLQNALMCSFNTDLINMQKRMGYGDEAPKWIARVIILILNIPAIIIGAKGYNVLSIFLIADLVCACAALPVFFGLIEEDKFGGLIPAPTELGAFLGTIAGIFTVVVNGVINGEEGGLFAYFWLNNGAVCSLCGSKTMVTFIVTPISAGFFALLFSKLDVLIRKENARKPIFYFLGEERPNKEPENEEPSVAEEEEVANEVPVEEA